MWVFAQSGPVLRNDGRSRRRTCCSANGHWFQHWRISKHRRRVLVQPIHLRTEGDVAFFGTLQSEFEKLVEDFSDCQVETVLQLMRRMTERTHALAAILTGAPARGETMPPASMLTRWYSVWERKPRSRA
jgi:hypothetical protein